MKQNAPGPISIGPGARKFRGTTLVRRAVYTSAARPSLGASNGDPTGANYSGGQALSLARLRGEFAEDAPTASHRPAALSRCALPLLFLIHAFENFPRTVAERRVPHECDHSFTTLSALSRQVLIAIRSRQAGRARSIEGGRFWLSTRRSPPSARSGSAGFPAAAATGASGAGPFSCATGGSPARP